MLVLNKEKKEIGHCEVQKHHLEGSKFIVPIAEEGEFCEACQVKHVLFTPLAFNICVHGRSELALMAHSLCEAKYLPGFRGN